jgi:hypothetical protein
MLSTDANKPMGKPGQRNRKKKSTQRTKSGQQQATGQETGIDPVRDAQAETSRESIQEVVHEIGQEIGKEASHDVSAPGASTEGTPGEASAMDAPAGELAVSDDLVPVSPQTIANAYADYTRKSFEQIWTLFGRLAAARSAAEAFELQMQFTKEACEIFAAESQKISDLHGELAKQRVMHFEGFVARVTQTTLELRATRH